ncbi:acyltransferase family protein [Hymenobacter sp. B1770]|uniref:acyltransferase family protein n=1 Tax=Hymenobacter sp. B1770 TaxID=1718788 RepID=UPI003CF8B2C0
MNSISAQISPSPVATKPPRIFFPNLDGLRFLAFFAVFLFHSFYSPDASVKASLVYQVPYSITRDGYLGVNFFFVLSGFLITYLLLIEKQLTGRVAIGAFYMRRILRIWPLYFAVVLFGFIIYPWLKMHFGQSAIQEPAQPLYYLLFLANFNEIYYGCETPSLAVLWSVAVEEQFYLVWPLLVAAVPMRRAGWLFIGVILLSMVFRAFNLGSNLVLGLHTLSVIGDMAMGGLTAWLCFRDDRLIKMVKGWSRRGIVTGYIAGVLFILARNLLVEIPPYLIFDRLLLSVFFAFILLEQNYAEHSVVKMSQFRFLSYWGTYTYGLYCLHYLALLFAIQIMHRSGLNSTPLGVVVGDNVVALLLALAVSWVSYNFYEKPFLKLKNRFAFITR